MAKDDAGKQTRAKLQPVNPLTSSNEWRAAVVKDAWAQTIVLGLSDAEKRIIAVCALRSSSGASHLQHIMFEQTGADIYVNIDMLYKLACLTGVKGNAVHVVERLVDIGALLIAGPKRLPGEVLEVNNKLLTCLVRQLK